MPNDLEFNCDSASSTGNDLDDFQPVAGFEFAPRKLGRRDGFSVVFDDDAFGQKFLRDKKCLNGAGQLRGDLLPVGGDEIRVQAVNAASQSFHTGS